MNKKYTERLQGYLGINQAFLGANAPKTKTKNRCCGRCNGFDDICITDTECKDHKELGCEICFGPRGDIEIN